MSDHWEFFPCRMGEHNASVYYDHGIRKRVNGLDLRRCARVAVGFTMPRVDGLPSDDEHDALTGLEDELAGEFIALGGVYVGRVSVDGARYFYAYVDAGSGEVEALAARLAVTTGYAAQAAVFDDPEMRAYWDTLYPTKQDWQVIQDLKVIERLQRDGDRLESARKIDHLAYFQDLRGADRFKRWLEAEGFDVDWVTMPDACDDLLGIGFSHACRPVLGDVTRHTARLFRVIEELGGRYTGWGTSVDLVHG